MGLAAERLTTPDGRPLLLFTPGSGAELVGTGTPHAGPAAEQRWNELRGEEVLYGAHRQDRTFLPPVGACPLCPTIPSHPPGPATEIPREAVDIAVFPNRFPATVARAQASGASGARMMGGRFGGVVLALLPAGVAPGGRAVDPAVVVRPR